jgi:hypothetical protein
VVGIFEIVKRAHDNLPPELKPKTKYDNANELQFISDFMGRKLDSKIYVALKLRSGTVTRLHISESAYITDRTELNAGSRQAVGKTGQIAEETTGNGFNAFYDETMAAIDSWGKDDGVPEEFKTSVFFYAWFDDDEYELPCETKLEYDEDEKRLFEKYPDKMNDRKIVWRRWKMAELGKSDKAKLGLSALQLFKQEYPSNLSEAFQASGNTFFDQEKVEEIVTKSPIKTTDYGLKIWYKPQPGHTYVLGCDPSTGKGVDNAAVDVWDVTPTLPKFVQVAQWHGFTDPYDLADIGEAAADWFNHALASVENNQLTTVLVLSKNYDNVYYTIRKDKKTEKRTKILGFGTNLKTRPLLLDNFRELFENDLLEINSEITKQEMRTFVIKENGKIEHADTKHDDALFAAFIALETRGAADSKVHFYEAASIA